MNIEREARTTRNVPMTPLIDVVFLLLIFFMLSTSFVRTESLELALPNASEVEVITPQPQIMQVYVAKGGYMYVGKTPVNEERLVSHLSKALVKNPDISVLLLSGKDVKVQQLVKVMDRIYLAGAKNLSVSNWEPATSGATSVQEQ